MVCTLLALFAPAVATIGFIHGDREFFGSMAVPTAICLLALAVVNATRFARHKSIRLMLVDNPAGHLVRQQLVIWTLLAVSLPLVTRLMPLLNLSHDSSFPTLYTAQMGLILLFVPTLLNSLYYGPTYSAAQGLVPLRSRAIAAAVLLFFQNLIGLGLGPLFFGMLSDWLRPEYGEESVRYVLYGAAFLGL